MNPTLLELDGVEAAYGECQVLFGMRLRIEPGQVVTLVGRNGMGKTTTVRCILGLTPIRGGDVRLSGQSVARLRPEQMAAKGIALVPEGRRIFPNLTVTENLLAFCRPGRWTPAMVFEQFPSLARRRDNFGNQLSGGEQQMLAIGRALLRNGQLLVIDEATEGLAPLIRQEIWRCLQRLKQEGMAMLLIDKYLDPLLQIGDRHHVIDRGAVVWSGNSDELRSASDVWEKYVGV
ncbi:ABC transporter ATP-binding protein [Hydrogenophaga sp.]|uniref:ABC transporter ATP-binding protein n=1 Tax=Hydrogenophaga sp. TaxID=1904254 RepID=UPI0035689BF1